MSYEKDEVAELNQKTESVKPKPKPKPWLRFWARVLDIYFCFNLITIVLFLLQPLSRPLLFSPYLGFVAIFFLDLSRICASNSRRDDSREIVAKRRH